MSRVETIGRATRQSSRCVECNGKGEILDDGDMFPELVDEDVWIECPVCCGSGRAPAGCAA